MANLNRLKISLRPKLSTFMDVQNGFHVVIDGGELAVSKIQADSVIKLR